jgi:hypothetical protein
VKRNNLSKEEFEFEDRADRWMSSLERGMRIRDEVHRSTRGLGEGSGSRHGDVYSDEGMWNVGAALEKLVLDEDWWDADADGADEDRHLDI